MCLLIRQPAGVTFSKTELRDFIRRNPDGYGYARSSRGRLVWGRMVTSAAEIIDSYYDTMAGKEGLLHFRMTTHGDTTERNAHPYPVTDEIVLAHNGILSSGNPYDPCSSDTAHFAEYIVRPIAISNPNLLFAPQWGDMIGGLIGRSNKLIIQHADGRHAIINASAGVLHRGAWMSNTYAWDNAANRAEYQHQHLFDTDPYDIPAKVTARSYNPLALCVKAYASGGTMGIARWASANPHGAGEILTDWYNVTERQIAELIKHDEPELVQLLEDIVIAEGGDAEETVAELMFD
jgi:hypothetical protein